MKRILLATITIALFVSLATSAYAVQYIAPSNSANVSIGSSNLLFLDNTNARVGVGTTSPIYGKLQVTQTSNTATGGIATINSGITTGAFLWADTGTVAHLDAGSGGTDNLSLNAGGGRVGIGTASPLFQLHIAGNTGVGVLAAGVDGTFTDILSSIYTGNSNEQNAIQASVSSTAENSGFNFMVSDGGGASTQKQAYRMSRASHRFYIGGTEKVTIDSSGNLGIADTSPDASLEVVNDGAGDSFLVADTNDGDTSPFVIQSDGDVGIGTTNPTAAKLVVSSAGGYPLALDSTQRYKLGFYDSGASEWWVASESGNLILHENGVGDKVVFEAGGNVGIATANPSYPLEVTGNIYSSAGMIAATHWTNTDIRKLSAATAMNFKNSAGTNEAVLDSSGNFGIEGNIYDITDATLSVNDALSVTGVISVSANNQALTLTSAAANNRVYGKFDNGGGGNLYWGAESNAGGVIFTGSTAHAAVIGTDNGNPLQFATNNAIKMSIISSGNVGIGDDTPDAKLDIESGNLMFSTDDDGVSDATGVERITLDSSGANVIITVG